MPRVEFDVLPDAARVWVFGAAAPIVGTASEHLLHAVDQHLAQWRAHGAPLVCGRAWRDDQFLVVAVDEAATNATGCSIDGMFRVLASLESQVGTSLVGGGSVFWRDPDGAVHVADRSAFRAAATRGDITADTQVFDTTVTTLGDWRSHFERPARDSWHARLI
jgi:hypothetical protein